MGDAFCAAHPGVRATGACSRCGTFGCGACLTQRGADWLCPACSSRVAVLPWDERETLGLWRAWWRTSVQLISSPGQTLSTANPEGTVGSSLLFAVLSLVVGYTPTFGLYALAMIPMALLGKGELGKDLDGLSPLIIPLVMVVYGGLLVVFQLAGVLIWAGIDHLGLMLLGAKPKSYTVTVRANALSMGPYLVGLVPFCGFYVFFIWALVLRVLALMHLHKTTGGKATAAVLVPVVLLCGGLMLFYAAVFALATGFAR
jgi:DNA-directed RNA polymerase subunit RPC12/RpoP